MKYQNDSIDLSKLIFALLIVFLHVGNNNGFVNIIAQYIARMGVPFFFTISGYLFLKKFNNNSRPLNVVNNAIKRLIKLYLIWIIIYMPIFIKGIIKDNNIMLFFQELLFKAPAFQWYTVALAVGILINVYIWSKFKLKTGIVMFIFILLYIIGCCGNTYIHILKLDSVFDGYLRIFLTTRNGIFFSPIFIFIGMLINKIEDKFDKTKSLCFFSFFFSIYLIEVYLVQSNLGKNEDCSMYFTMPLVIMFMCLLIIKSNIKLKYSRELRELSTFIFCSQYGFIFMNTILINKLMKIQLDSLILWICVIVEIIITFTLLRRIKYGQIILKNII
ncbi:acyltransferase family protein [Clostridium sp. NSJ-145]|uniref:acyltransferase family protein n=1 Tax=Clostridium sp. NSJ-145 TaxID=2897777 RepID=UPI001E43EAEC|nr:acyltransferase family protein [Clostridium sp. NSJ-145]MCD2502312.1 acyltransferase family protein [Clostridium sp. NSJ-145]